MNNNEQHLIESGDLEHYALGILSPEKEKSIEAAIAGSAALSSELRSIGRNFERYAKEHAVAPRAALRNTILAAALSADGGNNLTPSQQVSTSTPVAAIVPTSLYKRYAVIASVAFLLSSLSAVYFWNSANNASDRLNQTNKNLSTLQTQNTALQAQYNEFQSFAAFLHGTNVQSLRMEAQATAPQGSFAIISWNNSTGEAYLHSATLPALASEQSYQVWAISKGVPTNLGVFDASPSLPVHLGQVISAQGFMITAEPRGGSANPAPERVYLQASVHQNDNSEKKISSSSRHHKRGDDDDDRPVPGYR